MNRTEWLLSLKEGSKVKICRGLYRFRIEKIDRITKRYFVIGNSKYRRDNGDLSGQNNSWNWVSIYEITDKDLLILKRNRVKKEFEERIGKINNEDADKILDILVKDCQKQDKQFFNF